MRLKSLFLPIAVITLASSNISRAGPNDQVQFSQGFITQRNAIVNQWQQADPQVEIRWSDTSQTHFPVWLSGNLSPRMAGDAKDIAIRFLTERKTSFGLAAEPSKELAVTGVHKDQLKWEHVLVQQTHGSLPIEGKQILVHINPNKEVKAVNGYYLPNIQVDTSPRISSQQAINAATQAPPQKTVLKVQETKLIIYEFQGNAHLVWKVRLMTQSPPGDWNYYVDAKTGNVIDRYNALVSIKHRLTYNFGYRFCQGQPVGIPARRENDPPRGEIAVDAAHDNSGIVYDYYLNNHGRDSFDNQGGVITSLVHCGGPPNAYWTGTRMLYGDIGAVSFAQALDIVAHELTHGVTEHNGFGGLLYRNQSGAINESFSDIFGALVDSNDWSIGEDLPNGPSRYMDNPPRGNPPQPDHMDNYVRPDPRGNQMAQICSRSQMQDNGCVHFNSGIMNKAAFLMAQGGTHHGTTVRGIGRDQMGRIFYYALAQWGLPRQASFQDVRNATEQAARNLFPGNNTVRRAVTDAWTAVLENAVPPRPQPSPDSLNNFNCWNGIIPKLFNSILASRTGTLEYCARECFSNFSCQNFTYFPPNTCYLYRAVSETIPGTRADGKFCQRKGVASPSPSPQPVADGSLAVTNQGYIDFDVSFHYPSYSPRENDGDVRLQEPGRSALFIPINGATVAYAKVNQTTLKACATVPARTFATNPHTLGVNSTVCVRTKEGNISAVKVIQIRAIAVDLSYKTWRLLAPAVGCPGGQSSIGSCINGRCGGGFKCYGFDPLRGQAGTCCKSP